MIFAELNPVQIKLFQKSILTTLLEVEKTFFQLAEHDTGNVLIVCDRGSMDPLACEYIDAIAPLHAWITLM